MLNICGCLVHTKPDRTDEIIAVIEAAEGREVHAHENGRIVVTVEDTDGMRASDSIMDMHQIPGVLTVTLTYHHFEEVDAAAAVDADTPSLPQH